MKGGITSGVVYPLAVYELSKAYRFRNIGGTSAGAIAAVLTAAAEYRRQHGGGSAEGNAGFEALRALPQWLQQQSHLRRLFQPARPTRALFRFALSLLLTKGNILTRVVAAIFRSIYCVPSIVVVALAALVIADFVGNVNGVPSLVLAIVVTAALAFILALAGPVLWALRDLLRAVPANCYGLCNGMPPAGSEDPALTPWLSDKIDEFAGKDPAQPLTFGDLWNSSDPNARDVNIEMVTTNVTYGRPFTLPFAKAINEFYFDESEFAALFPARIVDWLKARPRPPTDANSSARRVALKDRGLYPLPLPADLPIVLAARMSLSFPILLSAIPMHGIDWNLPENEANPQNPVTHRCWFSDGGLSSNFPLQFFDAPIPSRPTFGINLRGFDETHAECDDECDNVWMPAGNNDFLPAARNDFDKKGPSVTGFLGAIVETMQNWNDNLQAQVPGFRDRIVHVFLSPAEGGLNLDMQEAIVTKLTERGACAGKELIAHFTAPSPQQGPQPTNWDNHRWVRFRTATAMLQQFIADFASVYDTQAYATLVNRGPDEAPFSYRLTPEQRAFVSSETQGVVTEGLRWKAAPPNDFATGRPHPDPELQVRPRI